MIKEAGLPNSAENRQKIEMFKEHFLPLIILWSLSTWSQFKAHDLFFWKVLMGCKSKLYFNVNYSLPKATYCADCRCHLSTRSFYIISLENRQNYVTCQVSFSIIHLIFPFEHVLCSSDALEEFLDLLELDFFSFVPERYMYLNLLRCFNLDNLHIIFLLIHYKTDVRYTRYKMSFVSSWE